MAQKFPFFCMVMNNNETYLTPNYMTSFQCIGKECIASCCIG